MSLFLAAVMATASPGIIDTTDPISDARRYGFVAQDGRDMIFIGCPQVGKREFGVYVSPYDYHGPTGVGMFNRTEAVGRVNQGKVYGADHWLMADTYIGYDDARIGGTGQLARFLTDFAAGNTFTFRYNSPITGVRTIQFNYSGGSDGIKQVLSVCNPPKLTEQLKKAGFLRAK